jgi:peroxiredoxin
MQEEIIKTGGVTQAVEHLLSKYKALSPITSIIIKEGIIKSFLPLKKYNQILQLN